MPKYPTIPHIIYIVLFLFVLVLSLNFLFLLYNDVYLKIVTNSVTSDDVIPIME